MKIVGFIPGALIPAAAVVALVHLVVEIRNAPPRPPLVPSGVSVEEVTAILDAYRAEAETCRRAVHACVELEDERMTRCLGEGP